MIVIVKRISIMYSNSILNLTVFTSPSLDFLQLHVVLAVSVVT